MKTILLLIITALLFMIWLEISKEEPFDDMKTKFENFEKSRYYTPENKNKHYKNITAKNDKRW